MSRKKLVSELIKACRKLDRQRPFTRAQWQAHCDRLAPHAERLKVDLEPLAMLGLEAN